MPSSRFAGDAYPGSAAAPLTAAEGGLGGGGRGSVPADFLCTGAPALLPSRPRALAPLSAARRTRGPQQEEKNRTGGFCRGHLCSPAWNRRRLGRGCCVTKGIKRCRRVASLKIKNPKETISDKVSQHPTESRGERRVALPHSRPALAAAPGTDPAELRLTPRDCFYFASAGPSRWKGIPTVNASSN